MSLFLVPLSGDVTCGYCGRYCPAQFDDRERRLVVAYQFRWCPHQLCPECAGGIVEACPVCAVSGPQDLTLAELETQAMRTLPREPDYHQPIWPWFLLAGTVSGLLMFWPQIARMLGI